MTPLLQIKNLSIEFLAGDLAIPAVSNLSLTVHRGETLAIVGESGSGKSVSSLSILQLLSTPPARFSSGEILFSADGVRSIDLLRQSVDQMRRIRGNQVAMIFQEPMTSLNPVFTCGSQVAEAIRSHQKLSAEEAKAQTIALFSKVQLPDPAGMYSRYPHQLSGGQKQRVMIAMAISCNPALLICDEPTTALDVTVQKTILELIRSLQSENNMGVIFITHDLGVVAEIADRAIVLYKGSIVESGTVADIFNAPMHPYTQGLLNCRPMLHQKGERLPVVADYLNNPDAIITSRLAIKTAQVDSMPQHLPSKIDKSLVSVKELCVWFPSRKNLLGKPTAYIKAVNNVSFDVFKGETLGLVGESGCGKTTLGRCLLRLIAPHSGKIFFDGIDMGSIGNKELKKLRRDIQIVFQDPYSSLNPRLRIGNAIVEPLKVHGMVHTSREGKERVVQLLEKVDLQADHFNRYPHEFSGGQRQRIVIARALALNPSFIVFDESVSALDVSVQAQVLNLINDLKREFGFTVIFISHDLSVVRYISDRILVMNKGEIVEIGPAEQVYQNPSSEYTRKLISAIPKA